MTINKQIITKEENQKLEKLARALKTQNKEIDQLNLKSCDVLIATKKIEEVTVFCLQLIKHEPLDFQLSRSRGALT